MCCGCKDEKDVIFICRKFINIVRNRDIKCRYGSMNKFFWDKIMWMYLFQLGERVR